MSQNAKENLARTLALLETRADAGSVDEIAIQVRAEYDRYIEKRNSIRVENSKLRRPSLKHKLLS